MFKRNIIKLIRERDERLSTLFLWAFKAQSTHVHRMDRRLQELELQMNKLLKSDFDSVESESLLIKDLRDQITDLREQNASLRDRLLQLSRHAPEDRHSCLVELYRVPVATEHKIAIAKAIRDFTGCSLRVASDVVNAAQTGDKTCYTSATRPYVQALYPDRFKDDVHSNLQRAKRARDLVTTLYNLGCEVRLALE